jgi:hypothetical protein
LGGVAVGDPTVPNLNESDILPPSHFQVHAGSRQTECN